MRMLHECLVFAILQTILQPYVTSFKFSAFAPRRSRPSGTAARRLPNLLKQVSSFTDVQQPASSSAIKIPCQSVLGDRSSRPVARKIPTEVNNALVGFATAIMTGVAGAPAAIAYVDPDDVGAVVSSDLPPIWVPLVVCAVLVVGIGLLQGSLGDVMSDEAKLGGMSGARAAKQSSRDRSMFKKKNEGP